LVLAVPVRLTCVQTPLSVHKFVQLKDLCLRTATRSIAAIIR
jgi:hypothetical protein